MKKFLKERYHLHMIGGGIFAYILTLTFAGVPIVFQYFLTLFLSGAFAIAWEWFWAMKNGNKEDYWDVCWTMVGATIILTINLIL